MSKDHDESEAADLHLRLSEKYMAYKELAERCILKVNPGEAGNTDYRCFYMQPDTIFLQEPRIQNAYRNNFVRAVGNPPSPEPLCLIADDLHLAYNQAIMDQSNPTSVKDSLCQFFKRRQYQLQHKRYKLQLRWAHHCLTSDLNDQVMAKLNPYYSKLQFELENCVMRHSRLGGTDHFDSCEKPNQKEGSSYGEEIPKPPVSAVRADDIDVYWRIVTYEDKITRKLERFVQHTKWTPMSNRFKIYEQSMFYFQKQRDQSLHVQKEQVERLQKKGDSLIRTKKLGDKGELELTQILNSKHTNKLAKKILSGKDLCFSKAKYNYEMPPLIFWNEVELKLSLQGLAERYKVYGDMESDNGHSFSYSVMVSFPATFQYQVVLNQFAPYDAVPKLIDPTDLAKKNIKKVLARNQKKYGRTQGANTLLERIEIEKHSKEQGVEFLNSVEKALFGEVNAGQLPDFPSIRVKKSDWIELVPFKPVLDNDQMYQASILSCEKNWIDEVLANMLESLNVQDVQSINLIIESLSQLHCDKVKYGQVKTDFLNFDTNDIDTFFTEDQMAFIQLLKQCFRAKIDVDPSKQGVEISHDSLHEIPQHLLFANYLLQVLSAREHKTKLFYSLNQFRAIQRRLTIELRELGTRDRVLGDAKLEMPMEHAGENRISSTDSGDSNTEVMTPVAQLGLNAADFSAIEEANPMSDALIDLNKYRFHKRIYNYLRTTCPIVPKFHATFGEPIERQEISQEIDMGKDNDKKHAENRKLVGRVDYLYKHDSSGLNLVRDDFGVHIMYDSTFADMRSMETELLKICSFYINKVEPMQDSDAKNIYPIVDRLKILDEALECESRFQDAKSRLVTAYLECYEHISDCLEQQRLIQVMVDEMAKRPRLNLCATHFKDSYDAEIECLEMKTKLIRELMNMLMSEEKRENTFVREYLDQTYRLLHDHLKEQWEYLQPENKEEELNQREVSLKNTGGSRLSKNDRLTNKSERKVVPDKLVIEQRRQEAMTKVLNKNSGRFKNLNDFSARLGLDLQGLKSLMEKQSERDNLVRATIHEHVAFIKMNEGYPYFLNATSTQQNNIKFTQQSNAVGILDFYDSFTSMPRAIAAIERAVKELQDVHIPDNGQLTTALELQTLKVLQQELQLIKEGDDNIKGINFLTDDSVVGNPDKMLFFTNELAACAKDQNQAHNPYVMSKLDVDEIDHFDFKPYMGYIDSVPLPPHKEAELPANIDERPILHKNFSIFYSKIKERSQGMIIPSTMILMCNSVEMLRLRNQLLNIIEQANILDKVYIKQSSMMGIEAKTNFPEPMNMEFFASNPPPHFINFISDGPGSDLSIKLAINEFDPSLRSMINFADSEAFKALILPLGLEELRAVVAYELMHLQILIVAVRTNQVQMDNVQRRLCECTFLEQGFVVANPYLDVLAKLQGPGSQEAKLQKMHSAEKSAANGMLSQKVSKGYYSIVAKKNQKKETVEKHFKIVKNSLLTIKEQKIEVTMKKVRTLKLVLCHDYCRAILARVYCDAVKLQILCEIDSLRRRSYMMPRENMFLELGVPKQGEYWCAAYREDTPDLGKGGKPLNDKKIDPFFNEQDNKITSFWQLPLNSEITNLQMLPDKFLEVNVPDCFSYVVGSPSENIQGEFNGNNMLLLIRKRLPKVELSDCLDVDSVVSKKGRLVEFEQGYDYNSVSMALKYLRYWKAVSNIFDLEFFTNKLTSSSFVIANVERMVLSGVPFYDDENDDDFLHQDESEHDDVNDNKFQDGVHNPLKNVLANRVAEKIAQEKREKMQLVTDLELIKDKFQLYKTIMTKQELQNNLQKAEVFLNEVQNIIFYSLLSTLYQMQDNYFKEKKGQKEVQSINEVIQNLAHQRDLKVTFLNGFHVNYSVTASSRVSVDQNIFCQDYDNFFKATQPVIDEAALNPSEFNLVNGIYLTNSLNLVTFKKYRPYMGHIQVQDYQYLNFALTNLNKDIRKYIQTNLGSIEMTLQQFILGKMKMEEKDIQHHHSYYAQVMSEKKNYLKTVIKARQLRRVYMMLKNKRMIPLEVSEYNMMYQQYADDLNWKIVQHIDHILSIRQNAANVFKKQIEVNIPQKENAAMKAYDQASSEIHVLQNEINKYMIQVASEMFNRETASLARVFDLTNLRTAVHVHPAQQFASTQNYAINKRHHLDIINKVGPMQKMLSQIKNRSHETETLTAGTGIVISSKDLNECIEQCCRSLIKFGEIEMRTRCEYLSLNLIQYENLLYIKDRQLVNLETKLKSAKQELNKIVNTKVFSRGNNLIYELDQNKRQMRMLKDNLFLLEKKLTEKIKLCYDRELEEARMQLADIRHQFKEFLDHVTAKVKDNVSEEIATIDNKMKQKSQLYQDLEMKTTQGLALEKFMSNVTNNTTINIDKLVINKDGSVRTQGGTDQKLLDQLEFHKSNELEARQEVLKLMDIIKKYRIFYKFKEIVVKERNQYKFDNLKQQLTSNTTLWEQLAESEKREKILKQEIERAQQEIATQEKIIERLKDDLKKEGREKQKLLQYKNTKSKRLDELEAKAREFEVLSSVNLNKILGLLESKEQKIQALTRIENNSNDMMEALRRMNDKNIAMLKKQSGEETKFKVEAMTKLEGLRQELIVLQGGEMPVQTVGFWREQCQGLFDICRKLKEDNEKLVDHLGLNSIDTEVHPLDQFNNNTDLLQYLNSKAGKGYHNRNKSQQIPNFVKTGYEQPVYGMSQGLFEHMLGSNRARASAVAGGSSSINSLMQPKDYEVQLPQIPAGNFRMSQASDSLVLGGNVAPSKFNPLQPHNIIADRTKKRNQPIGGNMFNSIEPGHKRMTLVENSRFLKETSIDRTTNITANISTINKGSPVHNQHHSTSINDGNLSKDQGNIFNFPANTNRSINQPIQEGTGTIEEGQDSLNLNIDQSNQKPLGMRGMTQYGEMSSTDNNSPHPTKDDTRTSHKKVLEPKVLQPKLIQPPAKLNLKLEGKQAMAQFVKRSK